MYPGLHFGVHACPSLMGSSGDGGDDDDDDGGGGGKSAHRYFAFLHVIIVDSFVFSSLTLLKR